MNFRMLHSISSSRYPGLQADNAIPPAYLSFTGFMHGVGGHRLNIATKYNNPFFYVDEEEEDAMILMWTCLWGV